MMIVDKILEWARGRGYAAVYGSAGQVNEMLTDVDLAASNDATVVVMHLVTDSATVDGKDTAVVAVYFASLCDFDFDGESLLPEQDRLKGIGKDLLNDIRTGNEMTYKDPRWQYGYDDYAENVCWVCLRVTLTASAADCVPLSPVPPTPPADYMYFEAQEANSTVALMSMLATAPDLEYSTDGEAWQEWQHTTADGTHTFDTLTLTAVGDRVYLRGDNPNGFLDLKNGEMSFFQMTGKLAAHGNAQSIVDGDTPTLVAKTMPMFSNYMTTGQPSDVLVSAPSMPATTLAGGCYAYMFSGCTGLTQAPSLPATTLAGGCYAYMFSGCTGLTQAPPLPATTLAEGCYENMFSDCTFNMSDDGTTFNFQCGATLPQTVGEETFTTPAELANWMGNTNGFTEP